MKDFQGYIIMTWCVAYNILFIALKETGHVDWHIAVVMAPIWIPVVFVFLVGFINGLITELAKRRK